MSKTEEGFKKITGVEEEPEFTNHSSIPAIPANPHDYHMINHRPRRLWLAVLLSLLLPGLGHIYIGKPIRALLFCVSFVLLTSISFKICLILSAPLNILSPIFLNLFGYTIMCLDAAFGAIKKGKQYQLKWYNRWYTYVIMIGCLFAIGEHNDDKGYDFARTKGRSMENTIHEGIYIVDYKAYKSKLPGYNDVVLINFPSLSYIPKNKTSGLKRCVGLPGHAIEIRNGSLLVDSLFIQLPASALIDKSDLTSTTNYKLHFPLLQVPKIGDIVDLNEMSLRDFLFIKSVIEQENPLDTVKISLQLFINNDYKGGQICFDPYSKSVTEYGMSMLDKKPYKLFTDDYAANECWYELQDIVDAIGMHYPRSNVELRKYLFLNGKKIVKYRVKGDYIFVLGDNRLNSMDSRIFGFIGKKLIKGKTLLEVVSWGKSLIDIKWDEIGKKVQ